MSERVTLVGKIGDGIGWMNDNWPRVLVAHKRELPFITDMYRGSLNFEPNSGEWRPPRDEELRLLARNDPSTRSFDFRICGNYIHPDCRVVKIAGREIEGWIYYAGVDDKYWPLGEDPKPLPRNRVEILCRKCLRDLLAEEKCQSGFSIEIEIKGIND